MIVRGWWLIGIGWLLAGCMTYAPDRSPVLQHIPTSDQDAAIFAGCVRAMARLSVHLDAVDVGTMNWINNYCAEIIRSFREERERSGMPST